MEYLVPIVIVAIGIGLLLLFLRRPTVIRPPTTAPAAKSDALAATPKGETLQEVLGELTADMPPGDTQRVRIVKGNTQIGWTVTRQLDKGTLSPDDLRKLVGGGSVGKLAGDVSVITDRDDAIASIAQLFSQCSISRHLCCRVVH